MRPRGRPPTPSARSSASDPVETAPTPTAARSFIFITAPLPKFRSIWPSAVSSACSRSNAPPFQPISRDPTLFLFQLTQSHRFEDDVLRLGRAQHGKVSSRLGRHERLQLGRRRPQPRPLAEAQKGEMRSPRVALGGAEQILLQTEREPLRAAVLREDE